ncbi:MULTISPECIES: LysR family transcriptional regulator [Bradyrhizobium]|uniref:Transcriptional regulator n=3 Tax=Bradyrhizobium TaxID=374 RepID=A0A410VID3_9BRAD|nr:MULTISPECIES: LysR family transcriptional regulator [Bradyrhizobium]MCG2628205.1 LysR family transcriptional regulator [Bradyrhizobium zhengyangense]MCG2643324.1 LysR family transcriptional regulator [Bradyrhizobium zhengyangense]MCG2670362.1 LysR family transcriptional regulator [Bradyrhizobium zhengyangense]MDN4985903.1 LysR family transcriptional regulator [Bradyrhizobium sp. WYCCWR 13022]MDN5002718.1 LysR family transcriptional regulator [Bradyrhizobium sp. WYCCWR 12677]
MDTLVSMKVFCLVAELKSFAAAAERLGISPAMASKHVMQLEKRLGSRLLNRTSRRVSLSESGALYFEQTRQMLESLDEVEAAVSNVTVVPRGTLRLTAPVWMANPKFSKVLADYQARYPQVRLNIDLSGRLVNLVEEGFDLALRATGTPDEALIARPITRVPFYMVATPAYLDRAKRPKNLAELSGHSLLHYALHSPGESITIQGESGTQTIKFNPVLLSGNETLLHLAALEGMGLAVLPKWLISEDLAAGRLEQVLPEQSIFESQLFAVYPTRKYLSAKVRTFIDFIAADKRLR